MADGSAINMEMLAKMQCRGKTQEEYVDDFGASSDMIRSHITARRQQAEAEEQKLQNVLAALRHAGYTQEEIDSLFNEGFITPEIREQLGSWQAPCETDRGPL